MATTAKIAQDAKEAEVRGASPQPLQSLRPPARLSTASSGSAASISGDLALQGYLPGVIKASW